MPSAYTFPSVHEVPEEIRRLDEMHYSLTERFGDRLSLAPLEESNPSTILDVGCGSGAWAIAAAVAFPKARVVAADIVPTPERPIPENLHFQQLDLTQGCPFQPSSFDVIHIRFVLAHVPNVQGLLDTVFKLVKPSGWVLFEDSEMLSECPEGQAHPAPFMLKYMTIWRSIMISRGTTPTICRNLRDIVEDSGLFKNINSRIIRISCSKPGGEHGEARLARVWKQSWEQITSTLSKSFASQGLTSELAAQGFAELTNPDLNITSDLYVVWAQKKI